MIAIIDMEFHVKLKGILHYKFDMESMSIIDMESMSKYAFLLSHM